MINGSSSDFPLGVDDWGQEFTNDNCEKLTAARWNQIQDSVYALEKCTQFLVRSGRPEYPSNLAAGRPVVLYKTYTVTVTGSDSEIKAASLSGFTTAEKALFAGEPLNPRYHQVLQVRKTPPTQRREHYFLAGLRGPLTDYSGDSGWSVLLSNLADRDREYQVPAGTYVLSLMISG